MIMSLMMILPIALAFSTSEAEVDIALGSGGSVGCADECFVPNEVFVDMGGTVTWKNIDVSGHTISAGNVMQSSGLFDSGMIAPNQTFTHTFDEVGSYPYFCMLHFWEAGIVTVEDPRYYDVELGEIVYTNSTGTYYVNGTAVIPEFPVAMIVLTVSMIGIIVMTARNRL